jgi:hypothetical protein
MEIDGFDTFVIIQQMLALACVMIVLRFGSAVGLSSNAIAVVA